MLYNMMTLCHLAVQCALSVVLFFCIRFYGMSALQGVAQ